MSQIVVRFRGTRAEAVSRIAATAASLATGGPALLGVQLRMGVALLSKGQQSFLILSRGGVDPDVGYAWKKLSPQTIARRPVSRDEKRSLGITGRRLRGLLTPAQDKRWKAIFGSRAAKLILQGMSEGAAKALAAQIAWAVLKSEGAMTKIGTLGTRVVDIGRDRGLLYRSLAPGVDDRPSGAAGQIFETPPGAVIVGSNVDHASHFHAVRPLWPEQIPDRWLAAVSTAAAKGLAAAIMRELEGRP